MCPAVMGKIRCPLRPQSLTLDRDRPEIPTPPPDPPACCTPQTLTLPPEVTAKPAQKHDSPSAAHRRSYARRTGAERGFATLKDPATSDITRGWCRIMGLAPRLLFTTCLTITRNQRITAAWDRRQEDNARRAAAGLPPRTRRRRRKPPATPDHHEHARPAALACSGTGAQDTTQPATHATHRTASTTSTPGMSDPDAKITQGPNVNKVLTET